MESRSIGELEVSLAGLGCNNFGGRLGREESIAVVHAAMDAGITFFDTADIYSSGRSEELIGEAIAGRRDDVIIGTKFGYPFDGEPSGSGAGADWIRTAVEGSLRRLGTDHIDLFQQHTPDTTVPIEETQEALDELVRSGKVRALGNSNFSAEQIDAAEALATDRGWARFVSAQNRFNLIDRGPLADVIPACAPTAWRSSPSSPSPQGCSPASTSAVGPSRRDPDWPGSRPSSRRRSSRSTTSSSSRPSRPSRPNAATPCSSWPSPGSPPSRPWPP